jgi:hypothetical protein
MGRFGVPSALVIGSIIPDLWYVLPFGSRHLSHSGPGLLFFCLPLGLTAYLLFHLLLKEPCISLLPPALGRRVQAFAVPGLPAAPLHGVFGSLVLGSLTHLLWDSVARAHGASAQPVNWLQHASTLLGSFVLAWWIWRKLRAAPVAGTGATKLSPAMRACAWMLLLAAGALAAAASAGEWPVSPDLSAIRQFVKTAAGAALQGLVGAVILYCLGWKLRARFT